jgi:S-formylglutathione hydrolase FrmB
MQAAVVLPKDWKSDPARKFPVIYSVPGFGGGIDHFSGLSPTAMTVRGDVPFIVVELDPNCPTGHSVFADSDNNGPWGKALVTELIPEIESKYRAIAEPGARFTTGHSSGGWSSLWLQVTYPDFFGGCWSTSPDPVDFRDWQMIDLYKPNQNLFTDEHGNPRPIARRGDTPFLFYKPFCDMERPIRGEQIGSFEAVFGPRRADGEPAHMYDRDTGAIDPKVIEAWKRYDIDLILRTHWNELGPKLKDKIHVYMGDMDTFYLDGAVRLLKKDLAELGSDAVIELVPGDHGTMMTPLLRQRINQEMAEQFRKWEQSHRSAATRKAA